MERQGVTKTNRRHQQKGTQPAVKPALSTRAPVHPLQYLHQTLGNQAISRFIQAKLRIGQPGDKYEQEADRVAEQVMRTPSAQTTKSEVVQRQGGKPEEEEEETVQTKPIIQQITSFVQPQAKEPEEKEDEETVQTEPMVGQVSSLVQRQEEEPEEEEEEETAQSKPVAMQAASLAQRQEEESEEEEEQVVQTRSSSTPDLTQSTASQIRSLRGGGQPLSEADRSFFEPRFGQDFSQVRIHTDGQAAETARAVNARAFTVGRNVVFEAGQYAPETIIGRRLLTHELTHVVQQSALPSHGATPTIQRMHTTDELKEYLAFLYTNRKIEDSIDSDHKAREIVYFWREDGKSFRLTPLIKILLIKEMQSGFTGDEDEEAILEILDRSSNKDLAIIFGSDGITVSDLNPDFHGDQWEWLQDFYERRFEGGMEALLTGTVTPKGKPISFGTPLASVFPKREYEEVEGPHPKAHMAASHAAKMLNQTNPKIWFDSWYNDKRDNNDNGRYDEDDRGEMRWRNSDGGHYDLGKVYPSGARIYFWGVETERVPPKSIMYKVCVDVVKESFIKGAGVSLITSTITKWQRGVGQIEAYCQRRREFQTWREDKGETYPNLLPGDIITYKTPKPDPHSHSGIVGPSGSIIHLPGPSNWFYFNRLSDNDMEATWQSTWRTFFGITQVSRYKGRGKKRRR